MGMPGGHVSDLCPETFLAVSSSAERYSINFARIFSRDHPC